MAPTVAAPRTRIESLTGLRFLAALAVVLYHYGFFCPYPGPLAGIAANGSMGVSLFFVLSGFVLTYTYASWFRHDVSRIRGFLWARLARIYPMYILALVVATRVALTVVDRGHMPGAEAASTLAVSWLSNLLLVQAYFSPSVMHLWNGPSWSLSAELTFYLAFPFFIRYVLSGCRRPRSLVALGVCVLIMRAVVFGGMVALLHARTAPQDFAAIVAYGVYYHPLVRIWEFLLGCVVGAAFLQLDASGFERVRNVLGRRSVRDWMLGLTLTALFAMPFLVAAALGNGPVATELRLFVFATPLFALLVGVLAAGPSFLSGLLGHRHLVLLGEASYSLYIIHVVLLTVFLRAFGAGRSLALPTTIGCIAATVALSLVAYRFIEVPARQLLRSGDLCYRVQRVFRARVASRWTA